MKQYLLFYLCITGDTNGKRQQSVDDDHDDDDDDRIEPDTVNISSDCMSPNISVCDDIETYSENVNNNSQAHSVDPGDSEATVSAVSAPSDTLAVEIDQNDIRFEFSVAKRRDCRNLVFTLDEKQYYGRNAKENKDGEAAYLCRLNNGLKCNARRYLKAGRLYSKIGTQAHNHGPQYEEHTNFQVEDCIKTECSNVNALVNSGSQTSAVSRIYDKHMQL